MRTIWKILHKKNNSRGFTLIEVLLVIAILAILAAVVIVAINPRKQLASARDAQRWNDINALMDALHQYALDHEGEYPAAITTEQLEICKPDSDSCIGKYDLSVLAEDQKYLVSIPVDPLCVSSNPMCNVNGTGYYLVKTNAGRMWLFSNYAENATGQISLIK